MTARAETARPSIVWFRQDLRIADQTALAAAAQQGPVLPVYILDDETPGDWRVGAAQRWWLHHSLESLAADLDRLGSPLVLRKGAAARTILRLAEEIGAARIHVTAAYEPWWQEADEAVAKQAELVRHAGGFLAEPASVLSGSGGRYRIFTPFWRALAQRMPPDDPRPAIGKLDRPGAHIRSDDLDDWRLRPRHPDWATGFCDWRPGAAGAKGALDRFTDHVTAYDHARNLPSIEGSSRLSPHLHFGEISIARVWHATEAASRQAGPYLRELGWRDFTANLIDQQPNYGKSNARAAMDRLRWRQGDAATRDFHAWSKGRTGFPIVDAGMRQLWATGWMHNRVRMIAASFLCKHLLIDWRRGERWFWDALVDADYANNSVNWQWVAGTGTDSSPFGRIMAPIVQSEKFDAADYIRRWVPELARLDDKVIHDPHGCGVAPGDYPEPLIGHREGRERALAALARSKA